MNKDTLRRLLSPAWDENTKAMLDAMLDDVAWINEIQTRGYTYSLSRREFDRARQRGRDIAELWILQSARKQILKELDNG